MSRRSFLALGAALGGVALGMWSCQEEPKVPATRAGEGRTFGPATAPGASTASAPATREAANATTRSSEAATQAAATGPTPDLGAELFPDASGRAIARAADAPVIVVPRTNWTKAKPNLKQINVMNGIDKITVHHTAMEVRMDAWSPTADAVENIRVFHSGSRPTDRNWADIAYHFVVDRAGRVWQGRPLAYQGAHVRGHNEHNLGIVLLGNFETQAPSAAQLWSLGAFIGFVRGVYGVPLESVFTHGELGMTSCPGKSLQSFMDRTRRGWGEEAGTAWVKFKKSATVPATEQPDGR